MRHSANHSLSELRAAAASDTDDKGELPMEGDLALFLMQFNDVASTNSWRDTQ